MKRIRPFRAGDEAAIAEICTRTADDGRDATGLLDDDAIWAAVWALPYVARHPDLAFVAELDGRVVGYVVGTDDTAAFERWFAERWWPAEGARWPRAASGSPRQAGVLGYADGRRDAGALAADYPAHLHIDLLPEGQRQGFGRRLIDALAEELRGRGVAGLHLTASPTNAGAVAFYPRVGFTPLPAEGGLGFGMRLHR